MRAPRLLVGLVALTVAALAVALGGCGRAEPAGGLKARSARAFVDSIGVNVHVSYYDTAYGDFEGWARRLRELGVRHVRDGLVLDQPRYLAAYQALARQGTRATLGLALDARIEPALALAAGPLRGVVEAVEGPNEPELFGGPGWEARLRQFAPALRRALAARRDLRVPLLGPSFTQADDRLRLRGLASQWGIENIHPYPGGNPPERGLGEALAASTEVGARQPVQATETGYHTALAERVPGQQPPVSEQAAGTYVPRLLAQYFASGVQRTFLYELLDEKPDPGLTEPEQHFGLLRSDLSPKPAFVALRNLITLVRRSPGEGARKPVDVTGGVKTLLLQRDDGSRLLLLWREESVWGAELRRSLSPGTTRARLTWPRGADDVAVSRPSAPGRAVEHRAHADQLDVEVGPDVSAVSFR